MYAPAVRLAVVHHTAGTNSYTPAQAAAIVRGIEVYHVKGNGWNDIGYNFLVDRFGTVYEGRGGRDRPQRDRRALAEGFNTGTSGVALIGNYVARDADEGEQDALVKLLAWRLDVAHVDPLSTVVYTSGGNAKFRAGKVVTLRAVSGHRDTGPSECPGAAPTVAARRSPSACPATGLPKLYSPAVVGVLGGPVRFQGAPQLVTAVDGDRGRPARAHGRERAGVGTAIDWTWSSPAAGSGPIHVDDRVGRRASRDGHAGHRQAAAARAHADADADAASISLTNLAALPAVATPAPDGSGSIMTVGFTLGTPARVTAQVHGHRRRACCSRRSPSSVRPATTRSCGTRAFCRTGATGWW